MKITSALTLLCLALPLCAQTTRQNLIVTQTSTSYGLDLYGLQVSFTGTMPDIPSNAQPLIALVDSEAMLVVESISPGALDTGTVQRAYLGTTRARHFSGALAFIGIPSQFGRSDKSGSCQLPPNSPQYINVVNQTLWICISGTWTAFPTVLPNAFPVSFIPFSANPAASIDAGISRTGPNAFGFGDGTPGDHSAAVTAGPFTGTTFTGSTFTGNSFAGGAFTGTTFNGDSFTGKTGTYTGDTAVVSSTTEISSKVGISTFGLDYASAITGSINGVDPTVLWQQYLEGMPACIASNQCSRSVGVNGVGSADSASNVTEVVGVFGGVTNGSMVANGVGGSFEAAATGNGTTGTKVRIWGINTLEVDNSPTTGVVYHDVQMLNEMDFNVRSTTTQVIGLTVGGGSLAQPASAIGFTVESLGGTASVPYLWDVGFYDFDGAARVGLQIGALSSLANSYSQPLIINSIKSDGTHASGTFQVDPTGNLFITPAQGNLFLGASGVTGATVSTNGITIPAGKRVNFPLTLFANLGATLANAGDFGLCANCTPNTAPCTTGGSVVPAYNNGAGIACQ